jgi:SAM-dependent methyltransferase
MTRERLGGRSTVSESAAAAGNAAQIDNWNSHAGETWVRYQEQLDRQIEPLGAAALLAVAPAIGERILDIGCGCGQTTLELAARVGPGGGVDGVDISRPMLAVARRRPLPRGAAAVQFREVDAQTGELGRGEFDAAFSRFGVMFFSDPVAAFGNVRAALKPQGRIGFVCWRALEHNDWMRIPLAAARPYLPAATAADPVAPGPFAFADADRLRGILAAAGWHSISIEALDTRIGSGDLEQTLQLACRVGPLGAALREHPQLLPDVTAAVRRALAPHASAAGVLLQAGVWIVHARCPQSA